MQESGVLLHDVTRKANSSDLAILVELLKLVIDNKPPHCIILISGDRDFANVISTLTARKYQVFLIHSPQVSISSSCHFLFIYGNIRRQKYCGMPRLKQWSGTNY